jgi:RNA polymerase sigma factor (sigma-70 family)
MLAILQHPYSYKNILITLAAMLHGLPGKTTPIAPKATQAAAQSQAAQLLDSYGNAVLRLAYSYVHNMADAEDILQETLIKYLQTKPVFTTQEHQRAWLLRVAANLCKNKLDYNRLRQTDDIDELADTLANENRSDLAFIWQTVKDLPASYRDAIHLYYYEGYSTSEIAGILDRNESSIRSDLRRGRARLKELLKEVYDFE